MQFRCVLIDELAQSERSAAIGNLPLPTTSCPRHHASRFSSEAPSSGPFASMAVVGSRIA